VLIIAHIVIVVKFILNPVRQIRLNSWNIIKSSETTWNRWSLEGQCLSACERFC